MNRDSIHSPQWITRGCATVTAVFALCVGSPRSNAQTDSIIIVNPRVGRYIDAPEREYFEIYPGIPDSDRVYVVRTTTDSGEVFLVTSTLGNVKPIRVGTEEIASLSGRIESIEHTRAVAEGLSSDEAGDQGVGSNVYVELASKGLVTGELLFADVHGMVVRGKSMKVVPASHIRTIKIGPRFGTATFYAMGGGVFLGILLSGVSGVAGGDTQAGFGVGAAVVLGSAAAILGFIYDLIREGIGTKKVYESGLPWNTNVLQTLRAECRYPLGTDSLKLLLAGVDND